MVETADKHLLPPVGCFYWGGNQTSEKTMAETMTTTEEVMHQLCNRDLIQIANELSHFIIPEDALCRKVSRQCGLDGMQVLHLIALAPALAKELAFRLEIELDEP